MIGKGAQKFLPLIVPLIIVQFCGGLGGVGVIEKVEFSGVGFLRLHIFSRGSGKTISFNRPFVN